MVRKKSGNNNCLRTFTTRIANGNDLKLVFVDYIPVVRFNMENLSECKLAAVQLVETSHCTQTEAAKICGFHRNTVFKLLRIKMILGVEALFEDHRGPKGAYKYIGEVRSHIKTLIRKYPDAKDQDIADQASKDLEKNISRSAVARIRTEQQDKKERTLSKAEQIAAAIVADTVDRERFDSHQMELNFTLDSEISEKIEECSKEAPIDATTKNDHCLIAKLQRGYRFNFAGASMHHLFLQEIGFEALASRYPFNSKAVFQASDILKTLFQSINLDIPSIEALKLVNADDLGLCSGIFRAPEKETVRDHLDQMAENYLSSNLIDAFAKALLQRGFIDLEVFFIDGHFLPYFGLYVIAKGYYTVRRLAMRGNELYSITDLQGRPLFFITESNEIDFRPIILRSAKKLLEYGINRPILVFDRGGYGINFFKELDQIAEFVTWAKYVSDNTLADIPESAFTVGMSFKDHRYLVAEQIRTVKESLQTAQKEGREEPSSIELRMVVLENIENKRRIAIYTNNRSKPLSNIAYYMLSRWGDSENIFKEMMARFNLNYHPGYDIKELENQPMVDNPDIGLIKKAISILRKEIEELEKDLLINELKQQQSPDKRRQPKMEKMKVSLKEKKTDVINFEEKLSQLPVKVCVKDLLKGKPMSRCDLEKKKLYDLMQFMAYNSRERLIELFRKCYNDHRDVKPVLDMITHRAGYVKLVGKTLIVVLDWIQNNKHREAAIKFCRLLNQTGIRLSGRLDLVLSFHISKYHVSCPQENTCTK